MNDVMVDLETMGNGPRAAVIAIGAVEMDFVASRIGETFYRVVDLESSVRAGLEMDASTVLWWLKQSDEARLAITQPGQSLGQALVDFSAWMQPHGEKKDLCVWGNGAAFDNVILASAYKAANIGMPWSHQSDRCYRMVRALYPEIPAGPDTGTKHNALDDAVYQARHLIAMLGPVHQQGKG
jgi:exodeoxyribonuclease VIII